MVSRLFRQHPDLQFAHPYHASIDDSVLHILQQEPQWRVVDLPDIAILHYGYAPGAIASRNKLEKARLSMERFLAEHPGDAYTCSKLGALYLQIDRINDGIELLERGLKSGQPEAPVLYELHYHLGIAYSRLKHAAQAAQHYQLAIAQPIVERLKLGALNNLGSLRKATGDLTGAKLAFESALAIAPDFATAHNNLGMTLKALGKLPDAIAHYQQAIALNPDYADAQQNLAVALLKLGRVPESMAHFQQAIALHQQHNPPEAQRLREGLLQMGFQLS
ncbi:MAG TPA: tetratricopeptide repeat protein, partial [Chroococcidiopsis sp.]